MSNETAEYKAIRDKIDDILLKFDFEKVADVMEHLNWKWYSTLYGSKVPSVKELRGKAYDLLIECAEVEDSVSSGGLEATCGHPLVEWDRDNCKFSVDLSLKFVLEAFD